METVGPIIPALVLAAITLLTVIACGVSINAESTVAKLSTPLPLVVSACPLVPVLLGNVSV